MIRPFLFLAGEFRVTQPLVFQHEPWQHTMTARRLVMNEDGTYRRDNNFSDRLQGSIWHASVDNEEIRRANLQFFIDNDLPCWPNPKILLSLDDRHVVMNRCINAGLISHQVVQGPMGIDIPFDYPFVVKTGNEHRGEGKHLVRNAEELPKWDGTATIEPFFEGISCRVLFIGDKHYGIRFDNEDSWIKNSCGAELTLWPEIPQNIIDHAKRVRDLFGLEVCGIDYIAGKSSNHFLEYNQFPGLDIDDSIEPDVIQFFAAKMKEIERIANDRNRT